MVLTWRLLGRGHVNAVSTAGTLTFMTVYFPSRILDWLSGGRLFGKNLMLYAQKPRVETIRRRGVRRSSLFWGSPAHPFQ